MDSYRQIRFLYPPLFFLFSIYTGILLDNDITIGNPIQSIIKGMDKNIIFSIVGVSSILISLGFLIGTISIFLLKLIFFYNGFNYEMKLSKNAYQKIAKQILHNSGDVISKNERHYAGVVFEHEFIPKSIHQWCTRRWNSFLISASVIVALVGALLIGFFVGINISSEWFVGSIVLILLFFIQAIISWRNVMNMIEFMIKVKAKDEKPLLINEL